MSDASNQESRGVTLDLECGNCGVKSKFPLTDHDRVPDDRTEMVGDTIGLTCEDCGHSSQKVTEVVGGGCDG